MVTDMEVFMTREVKEIVDEIDTQEQALKFLMAYARALTANSSPDTIYLALAYATKKVQPCEEVAKLMKAAVTHTYNCESPWPNGFF